MVIRQLSSYAELCALESEWRELWIQCEASPFQSPDWLLPWIEHLYRGGTLWAIVVYKENRLTALAPMFIYGDQQVAFIGTGVSDHLEFLAEDLESGQEIWREIACQEARWQTCDFQEIPCGSRMVEVPGDIPAQVVGSTPCPVLRLPVFNDRFEASLSPKFRHNLRNSRNRLRDLGATYETASPGQLHEFLGALFRLHGARWSMKGEPGVLATADVQLFLRNACVRLASRGALRLHGLRWNGELQSVVCIFCTPRSHQYYLGGFSDELSRYSPGASMIHFAIQNAIQEGALEFDFLRQSERYKYDWGAVDRPNSRILLSRQETSAGDR